MKLLFEDRTGLTLIEVLISMLLMSIVFLGISALYVASQRFYFDASDKVTISYELQYVAEHIYKHAMQGMGDKNTPAITDPGGGSTLSININDNNPLTSSNYSSTTTYTYTKSGDELIFDDGSGGPVESLASKITIDSAVFNLEGDTLLIFLTGSYKSQTIDFYSACYPRLASFQ